MNTDMLKQLIDYMDVLELIAKGTETVDELDDKLRKSVSNSAALTRRRRWIAEDPAYVSIEDGIITLDVDGLIRDLDEIHCRVIPAEYDEQLETKAKSEMKRLEDENMHLMKKVEDLEKSINEKDSELEDLRNRLEVASKAELRADLERKVLVASSIKVGPKVNANDDIFLNDPASLLDIDKCVAKYGGELDSFYEEIQTDEAPSEDNFEPGHELTERNYALDNYNTCCTERNLQKRVKDNKEANKVEEMVGKLFPGHGSKKEEWQKQRDRILRNRFISLNKIIECNAISNQQKLAMYAMNSEYHNTDMERLLSYAGRHCINANFLIDILEDPETCTTYENTKFFLQQLADASEFRMKLDLARQLIDGKWYITGDYNGKVTKFQLVPIDEFNELRVKAGLPVSKFCYKGDKNKVKEEKEDEEKESPKEPEYVIKASNPASIDLPDDGFVNACEGEEDLDLPFK